MCDDHLVAHGRVETQGGSEVQAPTPRLSPAHTGYQPIATSAIFWRRTLRAIRWTGFREQGWVVFGERPRREAITFEGKERKAAAPKLERLHHNAQRLLGPVTVFVPYAPLLEFPPDCTRSRRDNARLNNLIEAVALEGSRKAVHLCSPEPVHVENASSIGEAAGVGLP
jgi:hypothetical protein